MGRVVAEITIENLGDLWAVRRGALAANKVRRVVVRVWDLSPGWGDGAHEYVTLLPHVD